MQGDRGDRCDRGDRGDRGDREDPFDLSPSTLDPRPQDLNKQQNNKNKYN